MTQENKDTKLTKKTAEAYGTVSEERAMKENADTEKVTKKIIRPEIIAAGFSLILSKNSKLPPIFFTNIISK